MFVQHNRLNKLCPRCRIKKRDELRKNTDTTGGIRHGVPQAKPKDRKQIRNTSDRQKATNAKLAEIKAEKIKRLGNVCESCGQQCVVTLSHFIPGSKGSKYKINPNASCLMDLQCHYFYEHLVYKEIAKFKNLGTILDFLRDNNPLRYIKITDGIAKTREARNQPTDRPLPS